MKKIVTTVLMVCLSFTLSAQSDEILDILYEDDNAQTIYTSLLVLQAAGILEESATVDEAKDYLEGSSWGVTILEDEEYISAGSFSLLVMHTFDLPHGIMYNFLPIKRYALKELVFQKYILGNPYSHDIMSSFDVVYAVSSLPVSEDINKNYTEPITEVTSEVDAVIYAPVVDSDEFRPEDAQYDDTITSTFQ